MAAIAEEGGSTARVAGRRGRRRPDLRAAPFAVPGDEDWQQPKAVLRGLFLDAQARAIEACDWYLADRVRRKAFSRRLRGLALVLATAGGLVPLVGASLEKGVSGWGYVLIALAAVCVGFDRFLGLSSGWMRDMVTAQRIQRRLQEFQLDWTVLSAAQAQEQAIDPRAYLEMLRGFYTDLSEIMMEETSEWVAEFQSGLNQLQSQTDHRHS